MDANFVNELRRKTQQAIKDGEEQRNKAARERLELEEQTRIEQEAKAKTLLAEIPKRCAAAARNGMQTCQIMNSNHLDKDLYLRGGIEQAKPQATKTYTAYKVPNGIRDRDKVELSAAAQLIYDALLGIGLAPKIVFNYDGGGMYEWYELWAAW